MTPFPNTIYKNAENLQHIPFECLMLFDKHGNLSVFYTSFSKTKVKLKKKEIKYPIESRHFSIHNHLKDNSFSLVDIITIMNLLIKWSIVVTPNRWFCLELDVKNLLLLNRWEEMQKIKMEWNQLKRYTHTTNHYKMKEITKKYPNIFNSYIILHNGKFSNKSKFMLNKP